MFPSFFLCLTHLIFVIKIIRLYFLSFIRSFMMSSKFFAILAVATALSACSSDGGFDLSKFTAVDANASAKTRLRACLVSEANTKFQNGTLFAQGLTATASAAPSPHPAPTWENSLTTATSARQAPTCASTDNWTERSCRH